jgi:hypothetical protein
VRRAVCERGYALYLDFGFVARETAALAEEGQQDGKAQPVRSVLVITSSRSAGANSH